MNTQTKLVLVIFPIFLVLLVVSLVLFIKAGKKRGRKIAAVLAGISVLLALGLTVGCVATAQFLKRDYIAQTQLSFEDSTVKVTVKEWEFLQGSGGLPDLEKRFRGTLRQPDLWRHDPSLQKRILPCNG